MMGVRAHNPRTARSRPSAEGQTIVVRYATDIYVEQEFKMTSPPASPLLAGHVLEISFATFTPRITVHYERQLTVE